MTAQRRRLLMTKLFYRRAYGLEQGIAMARQVTD